MLQNSSSLLEVVQLAFKLVELLQLISDMETSWINLGSVHFVQFYSISKCDYLYLKWGEAVQLDKMHNLAKLI